MPAGKRRAQICFASVPQRRVSFTHCYEPLFEDLIFKILSLSSFSRCALACCSAVFAWKVIRSELSTAASYEGELERTFSGLAVEPSRREGPGRGRGLSSRPKSSAGAPCGLECEETEEEFRRLWDWPPPSRDLSLLLPRELRLRSRRGRRLSSPPNEFDGSRAGDRRPLPPLRRVLRSSSSGDDRLRLGRPWPGLLFGLRPRLWLRLRLRLPEYPDDPDDDDLDLADRRPRSRDRLRDGE